MKELKLFNTAHPLADTGKPIFIPFGEWKYDATRRQRLDRAHGERIANELNARVARGEPGIPVYQGHPDVPELASKYPDKGALGWVTKIELVNESAIGGLEDWRIGGLKGQSPNHTITQSTNNREGLALTVEWDRDPGKGFKWFSPYWFANEVERDGVTYIVSEISSIGLVNNPNIPEFRLANEEHPPMKPAIIELAAKYDRLANEFIEADHPRVPAGNPDGGEFTDAGGSGSGGGESQSARLDRMLGAARNGVAKSKAKAQAAKARADKASDERKKLMARLAELRERRLNLKRFNDDMEKRLRNEANFDESKHPRADDGKFTSGGGGSTDGQTQAKEKLKLMLKSGAVSIDKGGRPTKDDVVFEYNHKMYYIGKDSEHMVQEFADRGLVKRVRGYHNIGGQGRPKEKSDAKDSDPIPHPILRERERKQLYALWKELAKRYARYHR